ncbi:MAG TPA: sigma-70 family RNA polymerase sigma factor [Gemmataceae bacterium]|nr:sigma-70 family RNA polymerase sigma factor [Gemmataceae bacterium]
MATEDDDVTGRLHAARAGSAEALGQALETCRGYLLLIARQEMHPALQAKGNPSDLVQETFLDAVVDFGRFQGHSEAELRAWLRRLLLNNVVSFARRYRGADKRDVGREVGLALAEPGALAEALAASTPSPSKQAMARERDEALERAMRRLPEEYRTVLALRHQDDLSFEEIGQRLGRSANAARKLWARAVERLEQELEGPPS